MKSLTLVLHLICFALYLNAQNDQLTNKLLYTPSCTDKKISMNILSESMILLNGFPVDDSLNFIENGENYEIDLLGKESIDKFVKSLEAVKIKHLEWENTAIVNSIDNFDKFMDIKTDGFTPHFTVKGKRESSYFSKSYFVFSVKNKVVTTFLWIHKPTSLNKIQGNTFVIPMCSGSDFDKLIEMLSKKNIKAYLKERDKTKSLFKD